MLNKSAFLLRNVFTCQNSIKGIGVFLTIEAKSKGTFMPVEEAVSDWFYLEGEKTHGPYSTRQMRELLTSGAVTLATYICQEGMENWVTIGEVVEFNDSDKPLHGECSEQKPTTLSHMPTFDRWFRFNKERRAGRETQNGNGSTQIQPDKESVGNNGKQFVWWPASLIGNVIIAISISYFAVRLFGAISASIVLGQEGAPADFGGIVIEGVLLLLGMRTF
jgi:hypothetical protein